MRKSPTLVDLDRIEQCWPVPAHDPWNERLSHRNLACMWANLRHAGADRLIFVRVLETRGLLRRATEAVQWSPRKSCIGSDGCTWWTAGVNSRMAS